MYIGMCEGNLYDLHMGICLISVCLGIRFIETICKPVCFPLFLLNFHEIAFVSKK